MRTLGGCGLAVLLYLLTFNWPWKDIGWHHYYRSESISLFDSALAILAPVLSIFLLIVAHRRKTDLLGQGTVRVPAHTLWGLAPIAVAIAYCIMSASYAEGKRDFFDGSVPSFLLVTVYLGILGLATLAKGIVDRQVLFVNGGVLIVLGLILGKFFTSDVSFTVKGIAFIVCGCFFFVINILAGRQLKKTGGTQ
jgi:hypothetical protein